MNPTGIDDRERGRDLLGPQDPGSSSRADDDPRHEKHEIDELQRTLQVEKDKNKDLLWLGKKLVCRTDQESSRCTRGEETRERRRQPGAHEAKRQDWLQQRESFDLLIREKEQAKALGRQLGSELATAENDHKATVILSYR